MFVQPKRSRTSPAVLWPGKNPATTLMDDQLQMINSQQKNPELNRNVQANNLEFVKVNCQISVKLVQPNSDLYNLVVVYIAIRISNITISAL